MDKKKIAYLQFPGSNTENETKNILQKHGMIPFGHFWNDTPELLNNYDGFIILGGFSFEDRSRSGIIASLEPVVNELKKQALFGKPILGICNGAQILVESGLVPGNQDFQTLVSLTDNKRMIGNRIVGTRIAEHSFYKAPVWAASGRHQYVWGKTNVVPWLAMLTEPASRQPPAPVPTAGLVDPDELHHLPNRLKHVPVNYHVVTRRTPLYTLSLIHI